MRPEDVERDSQFFISLGYQPIKQLRDGDRYHAFLLERKGRQYFGKRISPFASPEKAPVLLERLRAQFWYYERVNQNPYLQGKIRCPEMEPKGEDFYIAESFGEPIFPDLRELTDLSKLDRGRLAEAIPVFARTLAQLDYAFWILQPNGPKPNRLAEGMGKWAWLQQALCHEFVTSSEILQTKDLLDRYQDDLEACVQHTDFVPDHVYLLNDGTVGLVDSENASYANPRFYDIAELYARLVTLTGYWDLAGDFLRQVLAEVRVDEQHFRRQFIPVVTLRSAGMLADAWCHYVHDAVDYRDRAKELLRRSMTEELESFL